MVSNIVHVLALLVVVQLVHVSIALPDTTVCTAASVKPPAGIVNMARPNITNQFHTRIEVVFVVKGQTEVIHEYFDAVNNRGFVEQTDTGVTYDALYSYKTNEFIGYFPAAKPGVQGSCQVQDLSSSDQRFLFGYERVNGHAHIFSAAGALHFAGNGITEQYMGSTYVRGIKVDWWQSCQYWKNMNATMMVDWYFNARGTWDTAVGVRVPCRRTLKGRLTTRPEFHTTSNITTTSLILSLTLAHMTVKDMRLRRLPVSWSKDDETFPVVPSDAFSFTTEILDTNNDKISFMKETFFYDQKLVKYEYRPQPGITALTAPAISLRYTIFIPKKNRNIDCDTWVATRSDFPFTFPSNSTWEWYFATKDWTKINAGPEAGAIPIQMRINIPTRSWAFQYNLYNFQKSKPDLLKFDISGCYTFRRRRKFQFIVPASPNVKATLSTNTEVFKYYVLLSIMQATQISPLRVASLQVFFADNVIVMFELLDKSPIVGDIQKAADYKEVDLDFAANTIKQMVQNGQFVINLGGTAFMNIRSLVATANSIIETTYLNTTTILQDTTQDGYGAGPMAAVGITMPLLGGGLGIVFAYFFFK